MHFDSAVALAASRLVFPSLRLLDAFFTTLMKWDIEVAIESAKEPTRQVELAFKRKSPCAEATSKFFTWVARDWIRTHVSPILEKLLVKDGLVRLNSLYTLNFFCNWLQNSLEFRSSL